MLRGGLTMRIVIVEQGRKPYETELERDLESMQHCVGGTIEAVYEPGGRDAALICNDEGKLLRLPAHRKKVTIGSFSAFRHVPPAKGTLMGLC